MFGEEEEKKDSAGDERVKAAGPPSSSEKKKEKRQRRQRPSSSPPPASSVSSASSASSLSSVSNNAAAAAAMMGRLTGNSPGWSELEALVAVAAASRGKKGKGKGVDKGGVGSGEEGDGDEDSDEDDDEKEAEILRRYIELCPFVEGGIGSPAVAAALEGLDRRHRLSATTWHDTSQNSACRDDDDDDDDDSMRRSIAPTATGGTKKELKSALKKPLPYGESQSKSPSYSRRKFPPLALSFASLLRVLLADVPVLLLLFVHYGFDWADHVKVTYLDEQVGAMLFNRYETPRVSEDATYFLRSCTADDITAKNGSELFLPRDATADDAYEHQLRHGFTVFPGVLSREAAEELRDHVISRNGNLTSRESIYVIENENRYSYGLSTTEPSVGRAAMEIANNDLLRNSLEKVLGPSPALIEMTAITSTFGAKNQYYHDDVIPEGSAIRYARTFGPSYSIFVMLQDTTREMGATGVCPGTHYCNDGDIRGMCKRKGFQVVGEDGLWRAGDALLMNMNSFHRGSAHKDPTAPDRVMLILTFSPKPRDRAESRMMSQGITFSLRWDMCGHTLDDLARANEVMVYPWAPLRSLGLYKLPGTSWGVDYITGSSQRMSNNDHGFKSEELDAYIEEGGLPLLPKFLQGKRKNETDTWYEYLQDAWYKCFCFFNLVFYSVIALYVAAYFPYARWQRVGARRALVRLVLAWAVAFCLCSAAKRHVDRTDWAADIRAGRRFSSVFANQTKFGVKAHGPTTLPNRYDVLIETRFGSEYLHMYEDYISNHPGNRDFLELVRGGARTYAAFPDNLKDDTARHIVSAVERSQGRFLYQGPLGRWHWISNKRSVVYTKRQLAAHSNPYVGMLTKNIRRLQSDYMYGIHRQTVLAQKYAVPYLKALDAKILGVPDLTRPSKGIESRPRKRTESGSGISSHPFMPATVLPKSPSLAEKAQYESRRTFLPPDSAEAPTEPFDDAWITAGDMVELLSDGFWYVGTVDWIDAIGHVSLSSSTGETVVASVHYTRTYKDYEMGEQVEVVGDDDYYYECEIVAENDDGTFDVYHVDFEDTVKGVTIDELRREAEPGDGEVKERKSAYG